VSFLQIRLNITRRRKSNYEIALLAERARRSRTSNRSSGGIRPC
jgi:hypothetical protein